MNADAHANRWTHLGLLLVASGTLMLEILLTRIFSVILWYHFAFVAVSVAMFGMTVGALIVYLRPRWFPPQGVHRQLAASALGLALTGAVCIVPLLSMSLEFPQSLSDAVRLLVVYVAISLPFVASGITVCLCLTRFPRQVSRLYAADLVGAALGCLLLIWVLDLTDGPSAVIAISIVTALGAVCFARGLPRCRLAHLGGMWAAICLAFVVFNTARGPEHSLLRVRWVKGKYEATPLFERWNSFSRVRVTGTPDVPEKPFGWGFSPNYVPTASARQLLLNIDSCAGTVLTAFDGDLGKLDYLDVDLTNLVHYLRPDSDVMVVGAGGGRDLLSALRFEQRSVVGVEVNENILAALTDRFGDFTGHLDRYPNVSLVHDEARAFLARSGRKFDIVQVSLIDTWAATAAGAFVLSENGHYTVESWATILEHLTDRGVLNLTRWYQPGDPTEMYRLTTLATRALQRIGASDPRAHILIAGTPADGGAAPVGTIIVGRQPLSGEDIALAGERLDALGFVPILTPEFSRDDTFAALADPARIDAEVASHPFRIHAPTDDNPFFFHVVRLSKVFDPATRRAASGALNVKAVMVLGQLAAIVLLLTGGCIVVPLLLTRRRTGQPAARPLLVYFCAIGLGFMFVEISQMQRLIVLLGRPVYAMSIVLFSLLVGTGMGSFLTHRLEAPRRLGDLARPLGALLAILVLFGVATPGVVRACATSPTIVQVGVSVLILLPLGLVMGIPFPWAMKLAARRSSELTPWFWGLNGAASVCATVLVVAISLWGSISVSYWVGTCCYVAGGAALAWAVVSEASARRAAEPLRTRGARTPAREAIAAGFSRSEVAVSSSP